LKEKQLGVEPEKEKWREGKKLGGRKVRRLREGGRQGAGKKLRGSWVNNTMGSESGIHL